MCLIKNTSYLLNWMIFDYYLHEIYKKLNKEATIDDIDKFSMDQERRVLYLVSSAEG